MITEIEDALGGKRTFTFDENLKLASETDALGNTTVHSHDHRGRRFATKFPNGARKIWKFGNDDYPELVTLFRNERSGVWRPRYDSQGQLRAVRCPFADENQRFEWHNGLLVVEHQGSRRVEYEYDQHKNLVAIKSAGAVYGRAYDRQGRLIRVNSPHGTREFRYDGVGRLVWVKEPDENIRHIQRDPEGNVVETKDGLRARRFSYTGFNWLASVEEDGTKVAFAYEPEGELREIQNEKRHPYGFWYDPCRRVCRVRGFDRRFVDYERDPAGQVIEINRAKGKTAITYDECGSITGHVYPDGTADKFAFGPDGLLDEAENATITVKFERDALGRVTKEFQGDHWVFSAYGGGNLIRVESSLGAAMRISRDEAGNAQSVSLGPMDTARQIDFKHDVEGFEIERHLPGGVVARWNYDQAGRPGLRSVRQSQSTGWTQEYVWNLDDRLSALVDSRFGKAEFVHDGRGRLIAGRVDGPTQTRSMDVVGNVYKTSDQSDRSFASGGVIRNDGEETFSFDSLGNMIARNGPGERNWSYAWDGAGMLAEVTRPDGKKVTMTYDALGRRISKAMDGVETRWIWSGNTLLHETKTGEEAVTWYHEPDGIAPMAKIVGERAFSIVTDHSRNPDRDVRRGRQACLADAVGSLGVPKNGSTEDGTACPWRWPGQYDNQEIGLYYNRFRYYDPKLGQYISQDPIGIEGGLALYSYVPDPFTWIDPWGLTSCDSTAQKRFDAAVTRHGGAVLSPQSALFPNRRFARQAASEVVGNMGPYKPTLTPTATSTATLTATCTRTFTATATDTSTTTSTSTPTPAQTCTEITARGIHFSAFDDFSFSSNPIPDGAWRYGYTDTLGSTLQLYTAKETTLHHGWTTTLPLSAWIMDPTIDEPDVIKNETGIDFDNGDNNWVYWPATVYLHFHPGPQNQFSVVRWTCPVAGNYRVDSAFRSLRIGGPATSTDTHVLHNSVAVYNGMINNYYADGEFPYAAVLAMQACDTLDFVVGVGYNGNYEFDSTGMRAIIDYDSPLP